jgi:2-polyprenyl-3-methyl-5-hydroxy-6-metoxy-1,4-benzoquinol methylase
MFSDLCIGVDVNTRGYNFVRSELGVDNVELLDLSAHLDNDNLSRLRHFEWDLILCPEVLEHITNPQKVLQNLTLLAHPGTTLVITGPNAFSFINFVNAFRRFEELNSDHNYWFTFYTLSHMLAVNGWTPSHLLYYQSPRKDYGCALCAR